MLKYLLALLFCVLASKAYSYEAGNYVLIMDEANVEFTAKEILDPYVKSSLETYLKKFSKGKLVVMYQTFPAIIGFFNHVLFLKDNGMDQFCFFDIFAEATEESLQCMEIRAGKINEWTIFELGGPGGGSLTYKGQN